jgi:hypothetical protein
MNFGIKEIEALREMRVADLYRIESLRAHCLEIVLNVWTESARLHTAASNPLGRSHYWSST